MPAGDERDVSLLKFFCTRFLGEIRDGERTYVTATTGYDDAPTRGFLNDRRSLEAVISGV